MAAAEAALARWARAEMELPPALAPPGPVLRSPPPRLCSGSCAPIWEFVTRHVRHPRNVQKIRGNLLWYRHLQEKEGAGPALREAVSSLRQELEGLGGALRGDQEAALELEAALEAELSRRRAGLRRGAELRLLEGAAAREGQRLRGGREALRPPPRRWEGAESELAAAVTAGMEPEVLASVRAVCRIRVEALEALLEPRPHGETQPLMEAANQRWLRAAEALLGRHPPGAVLGALRLLARESARPPPPPKTDPDPELDPDFDPDLDPEAPPTIKSLIRECWGAVGGLWGRLPPLAARLHPLQPRLAQLCRQLAQRLGGDPKSQRTTRLALEAAGLTGARRALARGVRELRGAGGPPKPDLGELRRRLHHERHRVGRRQRRLRALAGATRTLKGRLRPLQAQARGAAQAGLGRAPAALAAEGERLQQVLGALGALGALGEPPPGPPPDPLLPVCRALGLPLYEGRQGALCRAASLRQELRRLRLGAGPGEGAGPALPRPLAGVVVGGADSELLPRLQLVANQTRRCIEAWPRLQAIVSEWWEQPAQWTLAPPPGGVPFSHWLQRWTRAAQALPSPCPRPLPLAPPPRPAEGRGRAEPHP